MKGFLASVFLICFVSLHVVLIHGAFDFSPLTCDVNIANDADFQTFYAGISTGGPPKNVCFQPGNYTIAHAYTNAYSSQNWYGPGWNADPTCNGNPDLNCDRAVSAKNLDATKEAIFQHTGTTFYRASFITFDTYDFGLYGFTYVSGNPVSYHDPVFDVHGDAVVKNVYCSLSPTFGSTILAARGTNARFESNYVNGPASSASNAYFVNTFASSSLFVNNYFDGAYAGANSDTTYLDYTSPAPQGPVTVTGNTFRRGLSGVFINSNSAVSVYNNTFIGVPYGVYLVSSNTHYIDSNQFIMSGIYLMNGATSPSITNNVFVGPNTNAFGINEPDVIFSNGAFPSSVANNDFFDTSVFFPPAWNSNVFSHNYVPDGVTYYSVNTGYWYQNTLITHFTLSTSNPVNIGDFTTTNTPNHANLPANHLITVDWKLVDGSINRPYLLVGDVLNISWVFDHSFYDQYGIPDLLSQYTTKDLSLYASANGMASHYYPIVFSVDLNSGSHTYTLDSGSTRQDGQQYGYFAGFAATVKLQFTTPSPKSIFMQEPVSFTFNTPTVNGLFLSNQTGNVTANIYMASYIQNVTLSIKNTVNNHTQSFATLSSVPFTFDYGVYTNFTVPVEHAGNNVRWVLSATFNLPTGELWTIDDTTLWGYELPDTTVTPFNQTCYELSVNVDKSLRQGNPVQKFSLADLGCVTDKWEIISVTPQPNIYDYDSVNKKIALTIPSALSGTRPVHYQVASIADPTIIHSVVTQITIVNHPPVLGNTNFAYPAPRTGAFPTFNIISQCTDLDGDTMTIAQIQRTKTRDDSSVVQISPLQLYFVPESIFVSVSPNGDISVNLANTKTNPVSAGGSLPLTFKKIFGFQIQVSDGDVNKEYTWGDVRLNPSA
eukprot:TRINITY_DN2327_c0_g2_i1.p1 TRINITY_DN2327_c0_g2~~TRINITY_DN2327_c0_g2_i1.p1  ORF type:complete len:884 (+),score=162.94 TRINITY_DN2327_c0_g2_i1:188-2839(+)